VLAVQLLSTAVATCWQAPPPASVLSAEQLPASPPLTIPPPPSPLVPPLPPIMAVALVPAEPVACELPLAAPLLPMPPVPPAPVATTFPLAAAALPLPIPPPPFCGAPPPPSPDGCPDALVPPQLAAKPNVPSTTRTSAEKSSMFIGVRGRRLSFFHRLCGRDQRGTPSVEQRHSGPLCRSRPRCATASRHSSHERPVSVPVYDGSPKYVAGIPNMFRNVVNNLLCGSPLNVTYLPVRRAPPPPAST